MQRRDFIHAAIFSAVSFSTNGQAQNLESGTDVGLEEAGLSVLMDKLKKGQLTSLALCRFYLDRIKKFDKEGPGLNSIIELNPDALSEAAVLDKERVEGKMRGPLHGIPVLIKDNIATADKMETTAGSLALVGIKPLQDAGIVVRLRKAGAIILGKTNLSEWANMRSSRSTSGWSGRGGLTLNPYALNRNCSGSSSGTGAAISAGLAALGIGTETDGSIVSPASICGLVGIKPTVGLVSRSGIIPIAHSQDTAGPMTRTVSDAAALLEVLAGEDRRDPETGKTRIKRVPGTYLSALDEQALRGKRIGVARNFFGFHDEVDAVIEQALLVLKEKGAILIDPVEVPNVSKYAESELQVLLYEFKAGLQTYLDQTTPGRAIHSMADVIAFNEKNKNKELPHFAQEFLIQANAKEGLDSEAYLQALATNQRYAREEGIDQIMKSQRLDALVAPTGGPAWVNDFINGDHSGNGFSTPAAVAGYPHITVPAGFVHGLPVGLSFVGEAFSEARLIGMAYAFEQATHHRKPPGFIPVV